HLPLFCEPLPLEARVEGKTFGASKVLASLHRSSCRDYALWVAHNAAAALETRDENGKFGGWWGAKRHVGMAALPEGAVDYRNDKSELWRHSWTREGSMTSWADAVGAFG